MALHFAPVVSPADGMLPLSVGAGVPASPVGFQGLQLDQAGALYASTSEAIAHYHAGLPFSANGRLCMGAGPVARVEQCVPFNAAGRVAYTGASPVIDRVNQGVGFAADGTIATK